MGKSTISMAIFNSYFDITRGYIPYVDNILICICMIYGLVIIGIINSQALADFSEVSLIRLDVGHELF